MLKFNYVLIALILISLNSCNSKKNEISAIKEINQNLEMVTAYRDGFEALEKNDYYYASKKFLDVQFKPDYVSNITTKIIKDILETNNCELPTIQDLYKSHIELFEIFNKHLEKIRNEKMVLCPIT